jgi:hypothetical protein
MNISDKILAGAIALAVVVISLFLSVSICFAIAFVVCSLINLFAGYEVFGMASIAFLSILFFFLWEV